MEVINFLTTWYSIPFTGSIVLGLIVITVMSFFSDFSGSDADADVDLDHDIDTGFDHGVDHDIDHDVDGLEHGLDIKSILGLLGVGRCPISLVMVSLFFAFGVTGLLVNAIFLKAIIIPGILFFGVSVAVALIGSVAFTRVIAGWYSKLMPRTATTAIKVESLIGSYGTAEIEINSIFGRAIVKDKYGTMHIINCRTSESGKSISIGNDILLLQYFSQTNMFLVCEKPKLAKVI